MKLTDLDKKEFAKIALKENYKISFDASKLSKIETQTMLTKVRGLVQEIKESKNFHKEQTSPAFMKLVFMEQALVSHYNTILSKPSRIVIENEEVEKSQVVLAAQDMCDSIQKMLEDVGQMQVKELPALVDSIESEIGANESQSYNDQVSSQLDALSAVLKEAFNQLKAARDSVTGQGGTFTAPSTGMGSEMPGGAPVEEPTVTEPEMAEPAPLEEPAEEPTELPNVGRAKR